MRSSRHLIGNLRFVIGEPSGQSHLTVTVRGLGRRVRPEGLLTHLVRGDHTPDRRRAVVQRFPEAEERPSLNRLLSFESFVTAVQAGSISAAAERLGTTKSNVSRRVAELEDRLGVRLLNRNPRRLSTTDVGGEFFDQLSRLLGDLKTAEEHVADRAVGARGILRVACPLSFTTMHFKSLATKLMTANPELCLDLDCEDRTVDLVTGGHDCAIRLGQLPDSSLIARSVAPNRHVICASPDYLDRRGAPATPEDLVAHDGLHYSLREPHTMWQLGRDGKTASFRVGSRLRCNNGEMLQEAAVAGLGLAILPTFMAAEHLIAGRLSVVLPDWCPPAGSISVVFPKDKQPSVKLRVLIDGMLEAFGPIPSWDLRIDQLSAT